MSYYYDNYPLHYPLFFSRFYFRDVTLWFFGIMLMTIFVVSLIRNDTQKSKDGSIQKLWALDIANNSSIDVPFDYTLDIYVQDCQNTRTKKKRKRWFRRKKRAIDEPCGFGGTEKCNTYSGVYTIDSKTETIDFDVQQKTEVACDLQVELEDLLNKVTDYSVQKVKDSEPWESERLVLLGQNSTKLVFSEVVVGEIVKVELEGGFYGIQLSDGTKLLPNFDKVTMDQLEENKYKSFEMMGLRRSNVNTIYQWGVPVDFTAYRFTDKVVFGRPVMVKGKESVGKLREADDSDWCNFPISNELVIELETMENKNKLLEQWQEGSVHEHSSIASFAQLIMDLTAHGSPAHILEDATKAMADETKHTRMALSLVKAITGKSHTIDPLHLEPKIRSVEQLKQDNRRDACINEAKSAKLLLRQAEEYKAKGMPHLSAYIKEIADDELRHAQLGLKIADWLDKKDSQKIIYKGIS
jgi:heat shock protein HslJ